MFEYFLKRARGWRVLAHVIAPVIWFQTALLLTGIYARYNAAQGGPPLEETPFFHGDLAVERLASIVASDRVQTAFTFFALDAVNALLLGAGLAALIAFGLRALAWRGMLARAALTTPLALVCAEFCENGLLATALAVGGYQETIGAAAGVATGIKAVLFLLAALLAVCGAIVGLGAWGWRLLQRRP